MAASITYSLGLSMGPFQRGISQALSGLRGLGSQMASLTGITAGLAGLGGALGAGFGLFKGLNLAASMEETTASFEVLLKSGNRAREMLASIEQFSSSTPFEFPELADAARSLLAFRSSASGVVGELRMLGDISKGVGAPIGELATLYGKARVQGRLFADDINQLTGRGIGIYEELAKQFKVGTEEVKGLVEAGKIGFPQLQKAFVSLTSQGGSFFGMIEKQGRTFNAALSNVSDNFNGLLRAFATPAMVALKPALFELGEMLSKMRLQAAAWGKALADGVQVAIGLFKNGNLGTAIILSFKVGAMEAVNILVDGIQYAFKSIVPSIAKEMTKMIGGVVMGGVVVNGGGGDGGGVMPTGDLRKQLADLFADARNTMNPAKGLFGGLSSSLRTVFDSARQELAFTIGQAKLGGVGSALAAVSKGGDGSPGDRLSQVGRFMGKEAMQQARETRDLVRISKLSESHLRAIAGGQGRPAKATF